MKTRTDLLNFLADKYNLNRYLEIGVQNPAQNFDKIICEYKVSVDPDQKAKADFCLTSDQFFSLSEITDSVKHDGWRFMYDLIFIDGLHHADQVKKDFENSLKILSPNGFIVIHDCNPEKEEHTIVPRPTERGHWNGDVYKFAARLSSNWASFKTVDIDNGCGIFFKSFSGYSLGVEPTWGHFDKNRKELLNLISWDEFIKL